MPQQEIKPLSHEMRGRIAFSHYRYRRGPEIVCWDWADMSDWEKTQWVEWAKSDHEDGSMPPSLDSSDADPGGYPIALKAALGRTTR